MNIYFITNKSASRVWRMLPQANYMASIGHKVDVDEFATGINKEKVMWADVIVSELVFDWTLLRAIDGTNKKIVYEIDDLQEVVHPKHYAYKDTVWWQGLKRRFFLYYFMSQCSAFIVTNRLLKKRYSIFKRLGKKKKIYVLGNYMDMNYWDKPTQMNDTNEIRILWAGGSSHTGDLEYIKPVMKRILERYDNVKFIYMGHGGWSEEDNPFSEYNHGEHLFKDLPKNKIHMEYGVDWRYYPDKLATLRCDIGIAPVVENKFSRCKTPIKAMEYGINFMPTVGSAFLYKDVIIDGKTGFLAKNQEDFYKHLCTLIENKELRKKMGMAAHEHVTKNYDIKNHLSKWRQVFEGVGRF